MTLPSQVYVEHFNGSFAHVARKRPVWPKMLLIGFAWTIATAAGGYIASKGIALIAYGVAQEDTAND